MNFSSSLVKHTSNSNSSLSNTRPLPPQPSQPPITFRTAIVKFDYDASDTNELSVLAKEVKDKSMIIDLISFVCFVDSQCDLRWCRFGLDHHRKSRFEGTWTCASCLSTSWFFSFVVVINRFCDLIYFYKWEKKTKNLTNSYFSILCNWDMILILLCIEIYYYYYFLFCLILFNCILFTHGKTTEINMII